MPKFTSVAARIMVAISLVAAGACVVLAAFGLWRQQATVEVALQRELRADYANLLAALDELVPGLPGRSEPLVLEVVVEPDSTFRP